MGQFHIANIKLDGWKAGIAIVLLVLFMGYKVFGSREMNDPRLKEALRLEISSERLRESLPESQEALEAQDFEKLSELAEEREAKLEFIRIRSSRVPIPFFRADNQVVHVIYRWSDNPSSVKERYYDIEASGFRGWYIRRETSKAFYVLDWF